MPEILWKSIIALDFSIFNILTIKYEKQISIKDAHRGEAPRNVWLFISKIKWNPEKI